MEEIQKSKADIRKEMAVMIDRLSEDELSEKTREIEDRLFEFANFLEAKIALLYINKENEVISRDIIQRTFDYNKIVVLPLVNANANANELKLYKIDNPAKDLKSGPGGGLQPDAEKCRVVPIECIDIAIIPGIAFDEKGGRIGPGDGYYDRLIPNLPITTRKVALALDSQVIAQIPAESHDKQVDIIITEKRIIYKI
jgi:5-formyltetrahydrofolate cyclo-ligase